MDYEAEGLTETFHKRRKWLPKYTKILWLVQKGTPSSQIATMVGYSAIHINRIKSRPDFQEKLTSITRQVDAKIEEKLVDKGYKERARELLEQHVVRATQTIIRISKSGKPKDRVRLDAAWDILDRCGLKPKEVIETIERTYSPEETASMLQVASEVENVMERLTNQGSAYVLAKPEKPAPSPATDESSDVKEENKDVSNAGA